MTTLHNKTKKERVSTSQKVKEAAVENATLLGASATVPFNTLKGDAFWNFLFSKHPMDKCRKNVLTNIIKAVNRCNGCTLECLNTMYYDEHCGFLNYYDSADTSHLNLNSIFCTSSETFITDYPANTKPYQRIAELFDLCSDMFVLQKRGGDADQWTLRYIYNSDPAFETQTMAKNIFKSSTSIILAEEKRNVKLADKVFEVLPEKQRIPVEEVLQKVYADTGENLSGPRIRELDENPPISAFMLVCYLQHYWSRVFKFEIDSGENIMYIRRQCLRHEKPSQEIVPAEKKMENLHGFPVFIDASLFVEERGIVSHEIEIQFSENFSLFPPSDGFFLQFIELCNHRYYIKEELAKEWNRLQTIPKKKDRILHPNNTRLHLPCLVEIDEILYRCTITGQSNGKALVQAADIPFHGLVDIERLYAIPNHLIGILHTGVYGVLDKRTMHSDLQKGQWSDFCIKISLAAKKQCSGENAKVVAVFYGEADDIDYSGRRKEKHTIYKVNLHIYNPDEKQYRTEDL